MALLPVHKRVRGDLRRLHDEMDDLIGGFFGDWNLPFLERKPWPAIDIEENENELVVKAEIPGCKADDIDISVHGNTLTIEGEKKEVQEKKEKNYYHCERTYGNFRRTMNLPTEIDQGKIDGVYKDGILTLTLPKAETAKAVKVKIKQQ